MRLIPQSLVEVEPVSWCTRRCTFCAPGRIEAREKSRLTLSREHNDRLLDGLRACDFDGVLVYCGQYSEPLLHPHLCELIEAASIASCDNWLTACYTNGDLLDRAMADKLAGTGINQLVVDIYDDDTTRRLADELAGHPLLSRVDVIDHVRSAPTYFSRTNRVFGNLHRISAPCAMPMNKLLLSAEGLWVLCCEDYGHKTAGRWGGIDTVSPLALNANADFVAMRNGLMHGRSGYDPCRDCVRMEGRNEIKRIAATGRAIDHFQRVTT